MVLSIEQVNKSFGANVVLEHITAKIEDGDRIGLIGVNGAGKSTLLNLIIGDLQADSGSIAVSNDVSIGFLRQNSGLSTDQTIWEEMRGVFRPVLEMEQRLRELEKQMSRPDLDHEGEAYRALAEEYAVLDERFSKAEGYLIDVKIRTILNGMGFADKPKDTVIRTLSGGEKTRLALAKLLLEQPDLLILDEPTNHLDMKTKDILKQALLDFDGTLIVVSHDRDFLDGLVTKVYEFGNQKVTEHLEGIYEFMQRKKMENLRELERQR